MRCRRTIHFEQLCASQMILLLYVHGMSLIIQILEEISPGTVGGDADSTNTYGDRAPFGSMGGGERTKSGSRQYTRAILPSFGPHGCVKPYCCLFVYI